MSRLKRDRARKRLHELLSLAPDENFFIMVWAVDALQSGRAEAGEQFLVHPKEARGAELGSRFHANKWMLETLINELLTTRKKGPSKNGRNRTLDCGKFSTLAELINTLRTWEDAEDGLYLQENNVLNLLPKLGHRQFEWQRGFFSYAQVYRTLRLFSGELSRRYFVTSYGLSISEFFNCGFGFYALCTDAPGFKIGVDMSTIGIDACRRNAALKLMAASLEDAQSTARRLRDDIQPVAYKKSVLRQTPIILNDKAVARAPLRALIMHRITAGLYYDLVGGGSNIWREIGTEFESYCYELANAMFKTDVSASFKYKVRKTFDSPDVLVSDSSGEGIRLVIECKAKKMSFVAKFSDNPLEDDWRGFSEIVKGVVQVWRFFSHCRRNASICTLHKDVAGMILTLDPWLDVSTYRTKILEHAKELAAHLDPDITVEDQKHIVFCSIDDFENTVGRSSVESFFNAVDKSATPEYDGWMLFNIHERTTDDPSRKREYPFIGRIDELNHGWNIDKLFEEEQNASDADKASG